MATAATQARIVVGPADDGRRVSAEEYFRIEVQSGYRCELARGVLEVSQIPNEIHALLVCFFYKALGRYDDVHPGRIFLYGGANEFHFWMPGMSSGRNPDVAVSLRGAPLDPEGKRLASLVIEVVSAGKKARDRDYIAKRGEYLIFGIREYWIVDPMARKVTVLVRDGDVWAESGFVEGQDARGVVLPGFALAVGDLWAAIADHPEDGAEMPDA